MKHPIKKGLNLPLAGKPIQAIESGPEVKSVALLGEDYHGMKPTMLVSAGDKVQLGQPVFTDKKNEGVTYVAPASGTVREVNRGEKRKFLSLVIDVEDGQETTFKAFDDLKALDKSTIEGQLVKAGLFQAFRTRPFSKVPVIGSEADAIFVTAIDTNPLAADPELVIEGHKDLFVSGLQVLSKLTQGKTYVCTREDSRVPGDNIANVSFAQFSGPHPAGLVGTHIHFLHPVGPTSRPVWHIGYQDVIAIGHLFTTGKIMTERTLSVAGPLIDKPNLVRTRLGASIGDILAGRTVGENARVISGSVFCGHTAEGAVNYLGRYDNQISVLEEGTEREFLGWQKPGFDKFSVTKVYGGSWLKDKLFQLTTSSGGSKRAMVPVGTYERVVPLDLLPTQLLRALIIGAETGDTELAQSLGALELDEEDLALCTYVCPGKYEYGSILRKNLTLIEKEG
jgi:Na+-transporting NADH:ubiquinone oxidoreductase subunit A